MSIIVLVPVIAGISVICCFCAKRVRRAIVSDLRAAIAQPAPGSVVQAPGHVVHSELRATVAQPASGSMVQAPGHVVHSELRAAVAQPAPGNYVVQAPGHVVHVWEVDAPTMERFLEDLAKEKPIRFTVQELCTFTSNYSTRLGSGGFGIVYKGQLPNRVKIAVKVLNRNSVGRAEEQFMAEVTTIGRTYHRNLVRLYGFCFDEFTSALVYEYMENGSLDKYLFNDTQAIEEWEKLREIAIGTAKGIAYLHEECQQRIIHYDIKPGNVLLDKKFTPKVADFGLAMLCDIDSTHVSVSGYRGTRGYSAPEFELRNFRITHKCDVYSFGMLLFEIIGRRRNARRGSTDSLDWFPKQVWEEYEKGKLAAMLSGCWNEEKDREQVEKAAMVALWCVQGSPDDRPSMSEVVKMLEGGVEVMPPSKPFHYWLSISVTRPDARTL
ncbi:rust resistance kinase Lr10-like isoform X3 [Diospyros lotus]|uniref:rust resistance kinase Lr10-like isoform X3 n=1 Tax=Diospyros lotus TaxID=55363 RepID=UPI00225ADD6E|nr:rust resistance kinase Lr10-like isoform X3 [Diospyros lotus]